MRFFIQKQTDVMAFLFLINNSNVVVLGGGWAWDLEVRVRMKGDFTTRYRLFRCKISWLGAAPKFTVLSCELGSGTFDALA